MSPLDPANPADRLAYMLEGRANGRFAYLATPPRQITHWSDEHDLPGS